MADMLNIRWALDRGLLEESFDAALVAFSPTGSALGRLHIEGCWHVAEARNDAADTWRATVHDTIAATLSSVAEDGDGDDDGEAAADQLTEAVDLERESAPTLTRLEMPWAQLQALVDADRGNDSVLCECVSDPNDTWDTEIQIASLAGDLADLLDPGRPTSRSGEPGQVNHLAYSTRVARAAAEVSAMLYLLRRLRVVHNANLVAACRATVEAGAGLAGALDRDQAPAAEQDRARRDLLAQLLRRSARDGSRSAQPGPAMTSDALAAADEAAVHGWHQEAVRASRWHEVSVALSVITAAAATGVHIDLDTGRVLVRVPASVGDRLGSSYPVLSNDPAADPASL